MGSPETPGGPEHKQIFSMEEKAADRRFIQYQVEIGARMGEYNVVDDAAWHAYDPEPDVNDHGRWLKFYQGEVGPESPKVAFTEKKEGGVAVTFANNPLHDPEKKISQRGGSVYKRVHGYETDMWPINRIGLMTEAAQIWMEGIELKPEVVDQPTFIMGEDNHPVTLRSLIQEAQEYKAAFKAIKPKNRKGRVLEDEMKQLFQPKDMYDLAEQEPEVVRSLITARLSQQSEHGIPFRMGGKEFNPADLVEEINKNSYVGQAVTELEIARITTYNALLEQSAIITHRPAPHITFAE
jgi:hypothetical protein